MSSAKVSFEEHMKKPDSGRIAPRERSAAELAAIRADDKYYDPMTNNLEVAHVGMTRREKEQ